MSKKLNDEINEFCYFPLFNCILFIFPGNEDMHKSLNEFEIWPDATTSFDGNR